MSSSAQSIGTYTLSTRSAPAKVTTKACRSPSNLRVEVLGPTEGVIRWDRPNEASTIDMLLTNLNTGSQTPQS